MPIVSGEFFETVAIAENVAESLNALGLRHREVRRNIYLEQYSLPYKLYEYLTDYSFYIDGID